MIIPFASSSALISSRADMSLLLSDDGVPPPCPSVPELSTPGLPLVEELAVDSTAHVCTVLLLEVLST
jgi:hypothetical protein